jgi:hypothetical protein
MTTRRGAARAALAAAVLTAAALVAGCGVPTHTGVNVDGPVADAGAPGGYDPRPPPGPDEAESPQQLVEHFLQAAAGEPGDAVEQLREFIHSDQQEAWRPDPQVLVVRLEQDPVRTPAGLGRTGVRLDVRLIGVLRDGRIVPRDGTETRRYEFEVVTELAGPASNEVGVDVGEPRYRIVDPPNVVLLSDQALAMGPTSAGYLVPSPVYFWNSEHTVLVPDLRWLPTALTAPQAAQAKLEWLTDGPAPWLDSVEALPGDVGLEGNVVWVGDRLNITLTPAAAEIDARWLDPQVWWTLRTELRGRASAWLVVDGQEREVRPVESVNPAVARAPASFVVLDGAVTPYVTPDGSRTALPERVEAEVHTAAVSRTGNAALVHLEEDGRYRLTLASAEGVTTTELIATTMSRPLWLANLGGSGPLPSLGGTGLVVVDGDLYRFRTGEEDAVPVPVPGLSGEITALAAAPDGHRLAVIARGRLHMASLVRRDDGSVSVNTPVRLPTTASELAGVAFLQESWLAVMGREDGRWLLYELTIDGARERQLPNGDMGDQQTITNVVGYPGDPLSISSPRGELMFEADGRAYRYRYSLDPVPIGLDELGVDPEDVASEPRAPLFAE